MINIKIPSERRIKVAIDSIYDYSESHLGDKILNAFVPYGGIDELPENDQSLTFAFEHEIHEMFSFLKEFDKLLSCYSDDFINLSRIKLQLYCKIMESDYPYMIIYNLLNLIAGKEIDWNFKVTKNSETKYCDTPTKKICRIAELCKSYKFDIGKVLDNMWRADLRNSFLHSQYCLSPNGFFTNTRFYSPTASKKPAKRGYSAEEINLLYERSGGYINDFFKKYFAVIEKFKNGKTYKLLNGNTIYWNVKSHSWSFFRNA
jgi:hypothetical protein